MAVREGLRGRSGRTEVKAMMMKELEQFYKNKRVLVTGHTGFKGSWLCRILTLAGPR